MAKAFASLRLLFTAMLAVVLTLGPCASVSGVSGTGKAHAHELSGDVHNGSTHGHGAQSDHEPGENDKQRNCGELCESWAIHKSQRDHGHAILSEFSPSNDAPPLAVISAVEVWSMTARPAVFRPGGQVGESSGRIAAYALTNRYRL